MKIRGSKPSWNLLSIFLSKVKITWSHCYFFLRIINCIEHPVEESLVCVSCLQTIRKNNSEILVFNVKGLKDELGWWGNQQRLYFSVDYVDKQEDENSSQYYDSTKDAIKMKKITLAIFKNHWKEGSYKNTILPEDKKGIHCKFSPCIHH